MLDGWGYQDTHEMLNTFTWGPDGWLYGVHGSTSTARVRGISWLGQAVWRYHPTKHVFEIFAEGGGNTFGLEFDVVGRAYSGTNHGGPRGLHFVQGGYYVKNWGKHGALTNPYAFQVGGANYRVTGRLTGLLFDEEALVRGGEHGDHEVRLAYTAHPNRASNVPVVVRVGGREVKAVRVNQRVAPCPLGGCPVR